FQEEAVKRLVKFKHYEATVALVKYAVLSPFPFARKAAIAALRDRPIHEYVPLLLASLKSPLKSQFVVKWDARGRLAYDHVLLQQGSTANLLLLTHQLSLPNTSVQRTWTDS